MSSVSLLIDTSIYGAAVGVLSKGERDLAFCEISGDIVDSARQLPLIVQRGLGSIGQGLGDVDSIVVSQGPGSFTGIRVGLAYVYGLVSGSVQSEMSNGPDTPRTLGVSSLKLLAEWLAGREGADIVVALPATKTSGYIAMTSGQGTRLMPVDLTQGSVANEWPERWIIVGEWPVLVGLSELRQPPVKVSNIAGREAARMAIQAMAGSLTGDSVVAWSDELPPALYLRKSTVEEKALAEKTVVRP